MDRVLDRLWIGANEDLEHPHVLGALGFAGIVDLRGGGEPRITEALTIQNRDGDPWSKEQVRAAIDYIHDKLALGPVLVACAAGMSRSASMVIAYLVRTGWAADAAYRHVKSVRPIICPMPAMLTSAVEAVRV